MSLSKGLQCQGLLFQIILLVQKGVFHIVYFHLELLVLLAQLLSGVGLSGFDGVALPLFVFDL